MPSIKDKIKEKLVQNQGQDVFSSEDFTQFGSLKGIHSAFGRLCESGDLERVGRGKYRKTESEPKGSVAPRGEEPKTIKALTANRLRLAQSTSFLERRNSNLTQGTGYGGDRDYYYALGYKRTLTFRHFYDEFKRGNIAKRIINAPAKATWRNPPLVMDADGKEGAFAKAWHSLEKELSLFKAFEQADIKSRIGRYGILFLGMGGNLSQSAPKSGNLLYVSSFHEGRAEVEKWEDSPTTKRYGLPTEYTIDFTGNSTLSSAKTMAGKKVHWSRVIHINEDPVDNAIYGTPVLEAVFNNLTDMLKVTGGSAEAVWKTFDRGLAILLDSDATLSEEDEEAFEEEINRYVNDQQRFMRLQGAKVESLGAQAADPRGHFQVIASIVSGTTGIPQRILFGSERGQLASQADERNWNAQIKERQHDYAEPVILRPFLKFSVERGILPIPVGEIQTEWPDLTALSENEQVANTNKTAQAARNLEQVTYLSIEEKRGLLKFPREVDGTLPSKGPEDTGGNQSGRKKDSPTGA